VIVDASKHVSHAFLLRRVPGLDLRVVHLVRDSRGVALSWTRLRRPEVVDGQAMMATRPPVLLSVRWLTRNALFHLLRRLGVPTLLLRYESLVRGPAAELTRVWPMPASRPPPASWASSATAGCGSEPATPLQATRCGSSRGASRSDWTRSGVIS
jgi:hypothetical protein